MKITLKKPLAVILSLVMCLSVLFGMNLTIFAAESNVVNYVYDGNYVYNWGQRGTTATFLSPMASKFYGDKNISLDALLALDGSANTSNVPDSSLYDALYNLMVTSKYTSYDSTKDYFKYTDCQNSGGAISSFYSGVSVGPTWDGTFNREHVWPNSKSDGGSDTNTRRETDIMMLRPTATTENSGRGNTAYGKSSSYFNPNNYVGSTGYDLRGDVARIVLYVYVRWGGDSVYHDGALNYMWGSSGVIESKDVLIEWMEADPVDTWEMGRNDSTEAILGTRNVFVDYPELAFDLFNEAVPTNYTSPSGGASVEGTTGTGGSGSTGGDSGTDDTTVEGDHYVKVTSATDLTDGNYLIVYESGNVAFNGALSADAANNNIPVTISGNKIAVTSTTTTAEVVLETMSGGYAIKTKSGSYLSQSGTNAKIVYGASAFAHAISIDAGVAKIANAGNTSYMIMFNSTADQMRFRYYKGTQKDVALYKLVVSESGGEGGETPDPDPEEPTPDPEEPDEPTGGTTTEETVTISFTTTAQRVSQDSNAQIWSNNGLTFTNNKAASSNAVVSNVNPIRVYANSSVTVEHATGTIKSITFAASGSTYVTPLQNSVKTISGATVTTSGNNVTATFSTPVETLTISKVTAQFRLTSVTATVLIPSGGSGVTITAQSNNTSYGSVELSGNYIIATPNEGYEVVGYDVVSGTATVTQNGNNFTVEADADVTVQINFAPRTQYTVTFKEQGNTTSTQTAYSGDQITLPSITAGDYTVAGWVTATIDGETTEKPTFYTVGSKYTVTANTTLYALYSRTAAGGGSESNVFTKYTGAITEGDYLIVSDGYAVQAGVSSNRFTQSSVGTADSIDTPAAALIWTVTADGNYYTLYNESTGQYAAGTGTKNQGKLATTVDDYARWTVSGTATYEIVNKGNSAKSVNANIRRNGTYGFATYATSTGKALTLYKRTAAALTTYYFTGATAAEYTVTAQANNAEWGTVQVTGTTISATPAEGYKIVGYTVINGSAEVVQEGSAFFVTPASDVTVQINFEALPTYTVTFVEGDEEVGSESTYSGGFITLPTHTGELDEYTTFNGWAEKPNETDDSKIYKNGYQYPVKANVTLYAQYTVEVIETADHNFVKVTENQTDWTGTYLIVYEAGKKALNGAITEKVDIAENNVDVQIVDNKIAALDSNLAVTVVIEKIDGGYSMRTKSGLFFGSESNANSLLSNATKTYVNTITIDASGNAVITGEGGAILRYNATSGQERFRFYKTDSYSSQKPIALYKLDVGEISGAQVTVGSDLSMNYYVDISNVASIEDGALTMKFTLADGTISSTVALDKSKTVVKDSKTYYLFTFEGLAPQHMCDNIKAELLLNGTVVDSLGEYSIKQNAANLLSDSPSAELKQFVTDLLYYGAAAQTYTKYNTSNLATSGDIAALLGTPSNVEPTSDDAMSLTRNPDAPANSPYFRAASVWFDSTNKIIVKLVGVTANTQLFIDETLVEISYDSATDTYSFTTDEIEATRFSEVFVFDIYENDEFVQSLEYSINAYAYSKYQNSNNPNMATLALALYRVGKSAEAYAAKP